MPVIVLIYALLILIGGVMGHLKTGSTASLVSGIAFGLLLLLCAASLLTKRKPLWGAYGALILTFILDGFFSWRFIKTHAFLPAGLLSLISLAVLLYLAKTFSRRFPS